MVKKIAAIIFVVVIAAIASTYSKHEKENFKPSIASKKDREASQDDLANIPNLTLSIVYTNKDGMHSLSNSLDYFYHLGAKHAYVYFHPDTGISRDAIFLRKAKDLIYKGKLTLLEWPIDNPEMARQKAQEHSAWIAKDGLDYVYHYNQNDNKGDLQKISRSKDYLHEFGVCAIFQNEGQFLKEWLEYYLMMGGKHFYLYNNLSTDAYLEILKPYIDKGDATLVFWPFDNWHFEQLLSYNEGKKMAVGKTRWLAMIDIDEFIVPNFHDDLVSFMKEYKDFGGVCINWQVFGTSGVYDIPEHKLLIETLVMKRIENDPGNFFVKSIVQPHHVKLLSNHVHEYLEGYYGVFPDKTRYTTPNAWSLPDHQCLAEAQINHYWFRTENYFINEKVARRTRIVNKTEQYTPEKVAKLINEGNAVKDTKIQRFVPRLCERIFFTTQITEHSENKEPLLNN